MSEPSPNPDPGPQLPAPVGCVVFATLILCLPTLGPWIGWRNAFIVSCVLDTFLLIAMFIGYQSGKKK